MAIKADEKIVLGLDIPKTTKQINSDLKKVLSLLNNLKTSASLDIDVKDTSKSINSELAKIDTAPIEHLSKKLETLGLKNPLVNLTSFGVDKVKDALGELRKLDTLLTNVSKENQSLSSSQLSALGDDSFEAAGKYGKKAADYLSEIQKMSQSGYSNAPEMSELSLAAQTAGNMTAEMADQYLIASDRAYQLHGSVEKLMALLDGSRNITANHMLSMEELALAMSNVASYAAQTGIGADKATAALAAMIAATGQSGTDMAQGFQAVLANLRQVTDAETGITAEGLSKYESACKDLNVSLSETRDGVTSLREPMKILEDLSGAYSALSENDSRGNALLDSVGGGVNSDALKAMLENWSLYEEMLAEYSNGAGTIDVAVNKTADSWEGSLRIIIS